MADSSGTDSSSDVEFFAYGLLVCVLTICVSYIVRRAWPRHHYPKFFAFLAAVATVSGLYIFKVPGAGFGLGALALLGYLALHMPEGIESLFENDEKSRTNALRSEVSPMASGPAGVSPFWPIVFGTLIGIVLSASVVAAVVMPPANLGRWLTSSEPLNERVERALNPGDQWIATLAKERVASEGFKQSAAELAEIKKRLTDTEAALAKAQDDLGMTTSNTIRGIQIKARNGSRHADGAVYVGVEVAVPNAAFCDVQVSSDKVDSIKKYLHVGEAIPIDSRKGKFRVVLTSLDSQTCVFDLVKD